MNESEKKYQTLFESSRDALMLLALPSWKFISANQATLKLFGAADETEFFSCSLWDVLPERQQDGQLSFEKGQQMIATTIREGSCLFEWTYRRLDGKTFPAEVLLTLMEWDGEAALQASVRDISVRKSLEKEVLERRNELEALQRQQVAAQTAATIAHELNQPLLAIASYSEAVLMMLKAEKPNFDKVRQAVEESKQQVNRAGQCIREMLEFLSMKEFPTEVFDLNREIFDVLAIARTEHELQFHSILQLENGFPYVEANRIHIQKVLLNLLHNSIEAMQEIDVPQPLITITVRTEPDKNHAQITVQDNGPGFKSENRQSLFEPFFTTKVGGIGMGLVISRSLIEANRGRLWVDLNEVPGATFHLTLPFAS